MTLQTMETFYETNSTHNSSWPSLNPQRIHFNWTGPIIVGSLFLDPTTMLKQDLSIAFSLIMLSFEDSVVECFCPLESDRGITKMSGLHFTSLISFFLLSFSTAEGLFTNSENATVTGWETFVQALGYFLKMFFGSAALGTLTGLISAVVSRLLLCMCAFVYLIVFSVLSGFVKCSLTLWPVSETLWPKEDSFSGVWDDDHICISTLWPGRGIKTIWWAYTGTFYSILCVRLIRTVLL